LTEERFLEAVSCVAGRAGQLTSIDVTGQSELRFSLPLLKALVQAHASTLRALRMSGTLQLLLLPDRNVLLEFLALAPFFQLEGDVLSDASMALPLVRREGVYARVLVKRLVVSSGVEEGDVRLLLHSLGALHCLSLSNMILRMDLLEDVVDVVLQHRIPCLELNESIFPDDAGKPLARLLDGNSLTHLKCSHIFDEYLGRFWLEGLVEALRVNTSLLSLEVEDCTIPPTFTTEVLLPAVRDNTVLRFLRVVPDTVATFHVRCEAELLVRHRAEAERMAAYRRGHPS